IDYVQHLQTYPMHFFKFTYEKHQSKIEQNALRIETEQWKKSQPNHNFYFQPYSKLDGVITPLTFCLQTEWQKYLLVVKTNVNFCIVASFFIQYEDSKSIEEALKVIESWNDTWSPQYFVTDYCKAEYNAITKTLNCPSYICYFHRKQAWLRWTNKLDNFSVKDFRGEFLTLWRNIADSRDDTKFTEKNPKVQEYFIRNWLPVEAKWTDTFLKLEYNIKVATNNEFCCFSSESYFQKTFVTLTYLMTKYAQYLLHSRENSLFFKIIYGVNNVYDFPLNLRIMRVIYFVLQ
ncbi:hypothetical protein AGLY_010114, partial [Aphis glycines]